MSIKVDRAQAAFGIAGGDKPVDTGERARRREGDAIRRPQRYTEASTNRIDVEESIKSNNSGAHKGVFWPEIIIWGNAIDPG